jgi:phosphate transport system substrate-binding protein
VKFSKDLQVNPNRHTHSLAAGVSRVLFAAMFASTAATAAPMPVDPALPSYQPKPVKVPKGANYLLPDGSIRIMGAEHAQSIVEGFDALFIRTHSGYKFALQLKGTGGAMPGLTHGVTLFGPMGREVVGVEMVPYKKIVGQEPLELRVAHASNTSHKLATSLGIYVNKANPLDRLTMEQVARIFSTGQANGDVTRWGQLGLKEDWAKRAIHAYGTPEYTGFGDYMEKHHLAGLPLSPLSEPFPDTADILKHVSEDPAGIGFAAIGRASPEIKMLELADKEGGPYSAGSREDVVSGKYPLGRYLYFYVRRVPGQPLDPLVKEYMRVVFSKEGQQIIATEPDGYMPLAAGEVAAELAKLD